MSVAMRWGRLDFFFFRARVRFWFHNQGTTRVFLSFFVFCWSRTNENVYKNLPYVEIVTHLIVVDGANTQKKEMNNLSIHIAYIVALGYFEWRALHTTNK